MNGAHWPGGQIWAFATEGKLPLEDVSREAAWALERAKSGKRPWNWIEFELQRCELEYGIAPCQAELGVSGDHKCYNGWETCQDQDNFTPKSFWVRIAEGLQDAPRQFMFDDEGLEAFLPYLLRFSHTPSLPNPGETLGARAQFTAELQDAPHHDIGIDKYVAERDFDPAQQGTMLRKTKVRFPHYIGRRLRWYQGYITAEPRPADFRRREYVMERWEGPDAKGRTRIVCKDVLKVLDDERAQAPRKSRGELAEDLTAVATPSTLDIETSEPAEYDLEGPAGYVRIGREVFTHTGTTPIAGGVRLTGVSRTAPAPYTTEASAHAIGDLVQRCEYLSGTVAEVVERLMVGFGGMNQAYVPTAEWALEAATWAPEIIKRLITEPEGVKSLVDEIIGQTLTWGFWFDEIEQLIRYRALRPADVSDEVVALTEGANLVADSVQIVDAPDKIINEVQVLYGQVDPVKSRDEIENYRFGFAALDGDSQSTNELGQRRIKRIFGRWLFDLGTVQQMATRTLAASAKNLMTLTFKVERKDENLRTAEFADITTLYLIDQFGAPRTMRFQVLRAEVAGEAVSYRAREDFFKVLAFGRWAPEALEGLLWTAATAEQKERYLFWADEDGEFSNGDAGKSWQ